MRGDLERSARVGFCGDDGTFPKYVLSNLGGNVSRTRARIAELEAGPRETPDRTITARYDGPCADCGAQLSRGDTIRYSKSAGARCVDCGKGE